MQYSAERTGILGQMVYGIPAEQKQMNGATIFANPPQGKRRSWCLRRSDSEPEGSLNLLNRWLSDEGVKVIENKNKKESPRERNEHAQPVGGGLGQTVQCMEAGPCGNIKNIKQLSNEGQKMINN